MINAFKKSQFFSEKWDSHSNNSSADIIRRSTVEISNNAGKKKETCLRSKKGTTAKYGIFLADIIRRSI